MEPKHGLRDMVSRRVAYAGLGCMGKVSMGIDPVHGLQCMIIDHHEHGPLCMITMGMVSMGIVSTRRWSPVHGHCWPGYPWVLAMACLWTTSTGMVRMGTVSSAWPP